MVDDDRYQAACQRFCVAEPPWAAETRNTYGERALQFTHGFGHSRHTWGRTARLLAAATEIAVPILLISGARSDVASRTTVGEFPQLVPHAQHPELPHARHMLTGDSAGAFTREVMRFVQSLGLLPTARLSADAVCSQ